MLKSKKLKTEVQEMNNPNPQIQKIIDQNQCAYLYWYVFLNLLTIKDIFLGWDGEQVQLLQWDGEGFVLLQVEEEFQENAELPRDENVLCSQDLDAIPLGDIMLEYPDINPSKKPAEDIKTPKNKVGKFPLIIMAGDKKSTLLEQESSDSKNYQSPPKKLIAFFKKSRDEWKSKCIDAKEELKLAKKNIKNLRERQKTQKENIKCLEAEVSRLNSVKGVLEQEVNELQQTVDSRVDNAQALNVVPERHQYPIGIIYMSVSLVLTASTSMRGARKALEVFLSTLDFDCSIPSWTNGRLWLLRLGYYKLTRPKEKADDWIYVIDHFIQVDNKKCFVINGIRQSQ